MKRFRFPLRPVAVIRAHRETRAREAFALSVRHLVETEEQLGRLRVRLRALESALFSGRQQTFRAAEAALLLADYRHECDAEKAAEQQVEKARVQMNQRREEYLEARRAVKVVERLEEKARTAYRIEVDREAQAEADDFAGRRRVKPFSLSV